MPQTIAANEKNDLYLGPDGNIAVVFDIEAVKQACEHAAKAQLNEMIFNVDSGIPNFQTIWRSSNPNIAPFDSALRVAILSVDGVTSIEYLDISVENNQLSYTATINTIYGQVISNGL